MEKIISRANKKPLNAARHASKAAHMQTMVAKSFDKKQAAAALAKFDEDPKAITELRKQVQAESVKLPGVEKPWSSNLARNYALMALERIEHGIAVAEPKAVAEEPKKAESKEKEKVTA